MPIMLPDTAWFMSEARAWIDDAYSVWDLLTHFGADGAEDLTEDDVSHIISRNYFGGIKAFCAENA